MYTRSFYTDEGDKMNIPDNYSGTAFSEEQISPSQAEDIGYTSEKTEPTASVQKRDDGLFGIFNNLPFKKIFDGGIFTKNFKIGTEELIILGIAALLFFGKDGDKECALWLLILLFI